MDNPLQIDMVYSHSENFPWMKYQKLWQLPEIFDPQVEDGYPPAHEIDFIQQSDPRQHIWLVMEGSKALGFVVLEMRGLHWAEGHIAFRRDIRGYVKKYSAIWALEFAFCRLGVVKVNAFIARYNRTARFLVREIGMVEEGVITKSFVRNGQLVDRLVYGVTKDEFFVRFSA